LRLIVVKSCTIAPKAQFIPLKNPDKNCIFANYE